MNSPVHECDGETDLVHVHEGEQTHGRPLVHCHVPPEHTPHDLHGVLLLRADTGTYIRTYVCIIYACIIVSTYTHEVHN